MKEIRLHGRGGQGAVMAADMLANAFIQEDQYAVAFPMFGFERRGAPLTAFVRLDDKPIRQRTQVYQPHCLIVVDPWLYRSAGVFQGLQPDGVLVLNSAHPAVGSPHPNLRLAASVNATDIALQEMGRPITNTCMLGAFVRATGWLRWESLEECLPDYFSGKLLEDNLRCAERGYLEAKIVEYREAVDATEK